MAETTSIGWCDATINFWHGCQKVSEGCKFCYMFRDKEKFGQDGNNVVVTSPKNIAATLNNLGKQRASRLAAGNQEPLKIFTCSWSDFFIDQADSWREQAWNVIRDNPQFIWIILTKRPERIIQCLPKDWGPGWDHVWLLVSAENQDRWNERVPILCNIPAKIRGVSIEPIIGPVNIYSQVLKLPKLHWIIVGGESGNNTGKWLFRPAEIIWFMQIVKDCKENMISVFVKQLGTHLAKAWTSNSRNGDNIEQFPQSLQVQNFPKNDRQRI